MPYIGVSPPSAALTSSDITDNIITSAKIVDGTIAAGDLASGVGVTDLQPLKSDLTALALREATNETSAAFNLPNQFIDTFTDDTNLGTQTDGDRTSGYWGTVTSAAFSNDGNTKLLLHFDGTDAATSTTDASSSSHGITFNGTAQLDTAIKKFGTASLLLDGNSDLLDITGTTGDFNHGTGDFTYECWFYSDSFASTSKTIFMSGTHDNAGEVLVRGNTSSNMNIETRNDSNTHHAFTGGVTLSTGAWHHMALTKQTASNLLRLYINGVADGTVSTTGSYGSTTELHIGNMPGYSMYFDGNIDEFRVSDNCRYPDGTTFTPNGSVSATGTLIQSANTVASAKTKVGGTILYKDNAGTATLGTDLKIYFSCNNGGAWTEAASYNAITPVYSTGIKQVRLGETTCTSGTGVIYKAVWANQASGSKETQLHGIGINY